MRPYERLSDIEFESLIGDLLGAERDHRYERFRRGPDMGIDLRYCRKRSVEVVQCKHYIGSSFTQLRAQAEREASRLAMLDPQPTRYVFVTSRRLTPGNKDDLAEILGNWVKRPSDVLGGDDVEALLDRHPQVERRHVKLWLAGGTALQALLDRDVLARSSALVSAIDAALPLYVQTSAFLDAHEKLGNERVCLISGRPGIGKTTLARMLIADAAQQGFEPIEVSYDIDEAWRIIDPEIRQIFYYDDFLGTTTLGELNKNEDQRLVSFISEVATSSSSLFVLTTREYILQQARALYESFEKSGIDARKFLLSLDSYRRIDRAKILYNHVFHSSTLPIQVRESLAAGARYRQIVNTELFNPRLIAAITSEFGPGEIDAGVDFVDYAVSVFRDPEALWRRAFETQISPREHALLYALATMPREPQVSDLKKAYEAVSAALDVPLDPSGFERALEVLDDSLLETEMVDGHHIAKFINPSVEDFIGGRICQSEALIGQLFEASVYFEQVVALSRILGKAGMSERVESSIAARGVGLVDAESISWSRDYGRIRRPSRVRDVAIPEARLEFVLAFLSGRASSPCEAVARQIEGLPQRWHGGQFNASAALSLTKQALIPACPIEVSEDYLVALRDMLIEHARNATEYGRIAQLHDIAPSVFGPGEFRRIVDEFLEEARRILQEEPTSIESKEELQRYGVLAEEFGEPLDESLLEEAALEYEESEEPPDLDDWEDIDYDDYKERRYEERAEEREMDALFDNLADG